jgi:glycosyltransferase involved in cell wall biosynthesis
VTHFNDLFWDCGSTPTRVIEHGVVDPGYRYSGAIPHAAVVINEARRRARVTGTDLLERFAAGGVPIDLFGMDAGALGGRDDVPQHRLHEEMAERRLYLHPIRWTSLGLSLIEAMHLGMPVVALATTEAPDAVPAAAGVLSTRIDHLAEGARELLADPERAREAGLAARAAALERFGLQRFLDDWDDLLAEVVNA